MPRAHTAAVIWYSGTPTRLPRRSFRAADARALVDEDARLPEKARRKNRDRDEVGGAPPPAHYIPAQRELRGVELPILSHAPEDLLHAQHDVSQVDALCPDPTVAERLRPIIVARSKHQAQHTHLQARIIAQRGSRICRCCTRMSTFASTRSHLNELRPPVVRRPSTHRCRSIGNHGIGLPVAH